MAEIELLIVGGLGNQLYQFSTALFLAERHDINRITINTGHLAAYRENWGLALEKFVDFSKLEVEIRYIDRKHYVRPAKLFKKIGLRYTPLGYIDDTLLSNTTACSLKNNRYIMDDYFERIPERDEIDQWFLKFFKMDLVRPIEDVCVINVRGGEYRRLGWTSESQYRDYLEALDQLNLPSSTQIELVSDDIDYALRMFSNRLDFSKVHKPDMYDNFIAIASARYRVIAPSTFSRWASNINASGSITVEIGRVNV
ncbi:hypothetical protein [Sulfitobacter sp. 1A15299]|uniref:hypothetical protein n=1 Tax=Sulfitobacter sp. 1A15299 TaxID=3368598 RepID=UPI003746A1CE